MIKTNKVAAEIALKSIAALQGIETSSQKISQIIGVIEGVTLQTDLLAVHATGRALTAGGDARSFTVAASEIQIEEAPKPYAKIDTSLQQIIGRVAEINNAVSQISTSAEQQSLALQKITLPVGHINSATLQDAAIVEQAGAATRALAQLSVDLALVVARFTAAAAGAITRVLEGHRTTQNSQDPRILKMPQQATLPMSNSKNRREEL